MSKRASKPPTSLFSFGFSVSAGPRIENDPVIPARVPETVPVPGSADSSALWKHKHKPTTKQSTTMGAKKPSRKYKFCDTWRLSHPYAMKLPLAYTPQKMVSVRGFTWFAVPVMEILRMYTIVDVSGTDQYAVLQINDCDNNVCGVIS